jgi:hypothetical protein
VDIGLQDWDGIDAIGASKMNADVPPTEREANTDDNKNDKIQTLSGDADRMDHAFDSYQRTHFLLSDVVPESITNERENE